MEGSLSQFSGQPQGPHTTFPCPYATCEVTPEAALRVLGLPRSISCKNVMSSTR